MKSMKNVPSDLYLILKAILAGGSDVSHQCQVYRISEDILFSWNQHKIHAKLFQNAIFGIIGIIRIHFLNLKSTDQ